SAAKRSLSQKHLIEQRKLFVSIAVSHPQNAANPAAGGRGPFEQRAHYALSADHKARQHETSLLTAGTTQHDQVCDSWHIGAINQHVQLRERKYRLAGESGIERRDVCENSFAPQLFSLSVRLIQVGGAPRGGDDFHET